jgi:hypothetical protein
VVAWFSTSDHDFIGTCCLFGCSLCVCTSQSFVQQDGTARIFNCDNFNVDPLLLFAGSRLPLPVQLQRDQLRRWTDEIVAAGRQCPMGFVEGDAYDWVQYASLLSPNMAVASAQSNLVPVDIAIFGECLSMDCHPSGAEICISNNQAGIKVYSLYPRPELLAYTCAARVDQFPSARRFGNGPQSVSTKPVEISRVVYSHSGVLIATGGQDGGIATWLRPPQPNPSDGPVQLIRLGCTVLRSQQATLSALAASRSAPKGQSVMQLKWSADDLHLLAAGGTFVRSNSCEIGVCVSQRLTCCDFSGYGHCCGSFVGRIVIATSSLVAHQRYSHHVVASRVAECDSYCGARWHDQAYQLVHWTTGAASAGVLVSEFGCCVCF